MSSDNNKEKDKETESTLKKKKCPKMQPYKLLRYQFYSKLKTQYLDKLQLDPLKDAFHMSSILLRRATHADVAQLSKLVTDHTEAMFGDFDLHYLIEMSNCSLCQATRKGDIVAFIATTSIPNIPSIPPMKWSPWVETFYGMDDCTSRNTTFLQMILWHDKYRDKFMERFLKYLYMNDVRLQYVFVITPPGVKPFSCLTPELFRCLLPSNTGGAVGRKVQKLYLNVRRSLIQKLTIRRTLESDNLDIMPQLDQTAPQLRQLYGDYLVSELLRFSSDSRIGLTGLLNEKCRSFMLLSRNICFDTIQEFFEVTMFNGFQKKHKDDYIPKKSKQGVIEEIHLHIPHSISIQPNEPEVQHEEVKKEESDNQSLSAESSFQTLRSEESVRVSDIIYDYEKEEETKAFQLPPLVSPGLCFQAQSSLSRINLRPSESNIKGGILAHAGGRKSAKIVPYGVPPLIFKNERAEEPVFRGEGNAVIIEIFMMGEGIDFRLGYDFLEALFEVVPDVEYCLISLPSNEPVPPILHHFVRIQHRVGMLFPHELYCIHRNVIMGDVTVREAFPGDVMSVMELTSQMEKNRIVRDDFLDSITKKPPSLFSFVLMSENVLVGLCIVSKTGYDTTLLESQFDIDQHLTPSLHPHHAFIKHTIISPSFRKLTLLLFREVQRISSVTCLYYTLYDEDIMKSDRIRMTRITVIERLTQIAPRQQLQYQPVEKLKNVSGTENEESEEEDYLAPIRILQEFEKGLPFALFFTTNRLATITKRNIHTKIVVVGASETALSFIESLIFKTNGNVSFSNIFLVSPHGLPYRQKPHKARDAMLIFTGRYNYRYMIQLGLYATVNIVYGYMTAINREEKQIIVDYQNILPYDFLFLFCGLQFTKPIPYTLQKDKYHPSGSQNTKYVQRYLDEYPSNMFLVRSVVDAGHALVTIHKLIKDNINPEARIIVYGHTLQALAVVNGLLLFGVNPKMIAFVESFPSQPAVTLFNNVAIDNAVLKSITHAGVELYTNCHFSRWESNKSENAIKKVIFESVTKTIIVDCLCLFAFDFKSVDFRTFFSTITAGLVFDGRLVIDKYFRTNDPFIYAAGPLTKYKRRYFAEHLSHEYYNSSEIGAKLFNIVQKKLDPNSAEHDEDIEDEKEKQRRKEDEEEAEKNGIVDLPEFNKPKIQFCNLPGGWKYLHVMTPGIATPLECQLNNPTDSGPVYITGDCEDENGPGYFRLAFNSVNQVCEITCYTKQEIEVNNLVKLYGKHIALLNNIYQRFTLGTVPDLFEYFRQSWTCAIYHDRFEAVENKETELFYEENVNSSSGPFIDVITDLLEENFYSPLNDDEKDYLRDEFYKTGIVEGIQKTIKEYLVESKFQLPMYISDEYIIVQTESVKGRHLHSKPEAGITRADLLRMKEDDDQMEEQELSREVEEYEEENLDKDEEIIRDDEELGSEEIDSEEDMPHVIFEPKKQTSLDFPQPPQEKGTATDAGGFCVLSYLALHKDLKKCRYCHKYIAEDETSHSLIHAKERREEKEEEQNPFISITVEDPTVKSEPSTKHKSRCAESLISESINLDLEMDNNAFNDSKRSSLESAQATKTSQFCAGEDRLSHTEYDRDVLNYLYYQQQRFIENEDTISTASSRKKSIDSYVYRSSFMSSKSGRSSRSRSIKGRTSSMSHITSVTNIKDPESSIETMSEQESNEIRKNKIDEKLLEKQKRLVFDKIAKSWLRYY